jgi:hypothetical protein
MPQAEPSSKALQYGKDILVILVIPLMIWIVKLETGNAQRDLLLQQSMSEVARLEVRIGEIRDIDQRVQENALQLARLEGKLDTANGRLDEIRSILLER